MAEHCSILIIDDNIDDREVYRRILGRVSSTAYTVVEAETGEEGLALNGRKRPDCILLDYSLPGRDGLGVLADILESDPAANVIMLTGQGNETVAVEVMKSGARDYLTKDSLSPETLHRCIQNAIMHGMLEAKLEQKRQSLEIFTRAMAHDLKEPLRTIKSFSRILHGSAALPAEDRELLDYVLSAADHMEDLIVKVSGFTKLEAYGGLELRPVSLSDVLDQVEDNLRQQTESRGAVIIRGALPEVMGDATLLTQLLQNLVSNAIRYCEQKVPEISITGEAQGDICRLTVRDNGPGIDPEHRELIFQPFKRLVGRGIEGTGLGLAICRRIAQMHGGSIWCEAENGLGATFILEVPLAETRSTPPAASAIPHSARPAEQPGEGSGRLAEVLLVEDSPADIQILKIKLMRREKVNFNLHVATNGREAMRLLEERAGIADVPQIDLMLLDINMPIMDGFEVLHALSADVRLKQIPVCILSTSSDESDMRRARNLGARAYMVKPPTLQQLEEALEDVEHLELLQRGDSLALCAEQN
ncbi:response regulator [Rhizobium ruizarguesonis]|uniref:response regulator n=1 Tax=Rhizobium ruizarguesonis TaxID=2081791 RepID=UPI00037A77B4|nr:response regulator [Rhizobium ruizarguesonis]MBY5829974.1 response regulator [Rhizobium leguminosarum]QJS26093.1 response regulator [Rhizobium leguminosarum bv. trifolii TA1]TBY69045.1 response regulator [Rhizobium leguminosarum bv. viciae]MBY5858684.1 response regulator [Rhizobium leguminosarum]MBY5873596.1 response regulator [Rhizobium leguminosarum]